MKRKLPFYFLGALFILLVFMIGLRYGQQVERVNKITSYLISIPPSPTKTPTLPPFSLIAYHHKNCDVSFSFPNSFHIEKETSMSANLVEGKTTHLTLSCDPKTIIPAQDELKTATDELKLQEKAMKYISLGDNTRFVYTKNKKNILFTVSSIYLPLFEKSIE